MSCSNFLWKAPSCKVPILSVTYVHGDAVTGENHTTRAEKDIYHSIESSDAFADAENVRQPLSQLRMAKQSKDVLGAVTGFLLSSHASNKSRADKIAYTTSMVSGVIQSGDRRPTQAMGGQNRLETPSTIQIEGLIRRVLC